MPLALADFGRDARRSESERARRSFVCFVSQQTVGLDGVNCRPRRPVSEQTLQSLVVGVLGTDYGNATLAGVASNQLDRLQSVINAAARLVCSATTSHRCSRTFIGYACHSGSSSNSLCLPSVACMVWLRHTLHENCTVWRTWTRDGDFVPLRRSS